MRDNRVLKKLREKIWYPGMDDKVAIDFYGPPRSGQYLLVVIETNSKFPEVEIASGNCIPKLDRIFATHGTP